MIHLVKCGFAKPVRDRLRFAGTLCMALGVLAVASPAASAQLSELTGPVKLPVDDGAVGGVLPDGPVKDVVDEVVNSELPGPVEQVVDESPVAPVRDEVRRIVSGGGENGGGGNGGGGGGSGSTGSGSGTGAGSGTGTGSNGTSGSGTTGSGDTPNRGSRGSDGPRSGGGRSGDSGARAGDRAASRRAASEARDPGRTRSRSSTGRRRDAEGARDEGGSAAARTIETIVHAVPTPIWIALGVLFLVALALGARTFVERRRARALARERQQLLHDVDALERALLPAVPEQVGALGTSVAYRSCDGPAAGGDFYDAFELSRGRAAVMIGDVSGHGPEALKHGLRPLPAARAPRRGDLSAPAIAMVGERAPVQLAGRFTTVVVAVHDPAAGTLTYATAGHPPPIIIGPGAEDLLGTGASPPIGVRPPDRRCATTQWRSRPAPSPASTPTASSRPGRATACSAAGVSRRWSPS